MSKCGKASIIIPVLLRCWLKPHHVCQAYKDKLKKRVLSCKYLDGTLTAVDTIVSGFGRLAKNNLLISAFKLGDEDRRTFHHQILDARCWVLLLMDAVASSPDSKPKKPKAKQSKTRGSKSQRPSNKQPWLARSEAVAVVSCDDTDVLTKSLPD